MIECLLWDFGDTLCDELSLWRGSPDWMAVYHSFGEENGIGAAWNLGAISDEEAIQRLADQLPLSELQIRQHLLRTELFDFFPSAYAFFQARHLPQAVVTVNPPLFREIAAVLGMDEWVDTIVVSGEEKTDDKGALCEIALERMKGSHPAECSLLIDNRRDNLESWRIRGGSGYHFTTDDAFERDSRGGVAGLSAVAGGGASL